MMAIREPGIFFEKRGVIAISKTLTMLIRAFHGSIVLICLK